MNETAHQSAGDTGDDGAVGGAIGSATEPTAATAATPRAGGGGEGPPWMPARVTRARLDAWWLAGLGAMWVVGVAHFGVVGLARAAVAAAALVVVYEALRAMAREGGGGGSPVVGGVDARGHVWGLALATGVVLPVGVPMALAAATGAVAGGLSWCVGRSRSWRVHPVGLAAVLVLLLPAVAGGWTAGETTRSARSGLVTGPSAVLRADVRGRGDLRDATDAEAMAEPGAWVLVHAEPLLRREGYLAQRLGVGELRPMGAVVGGAVPGAFAGTSVAAVFVLGVWLMNRRLASLKAAAWGGAGAAVAWLVLPVQSDGGVTVLVSPLLQLKPAESAALLGYLMLATPLPAVVLVLAPLTQPTSQAGRVVYGLVVGGFAVLGMWALRVPEAALLGLVAGGLLSRPLDRLHRRAFP